MAASLFGQWRKVGEPAKAPTQETPTAVTSPGPVSAGSSEVSPRTSGGGWRKVGEAPATARPKLESATTPPVANPPVANPPVAGGPAPETLGDAVIFKTETREVNLTFAASGGNGASLLNLTQNDVEVYEDGAKRTITHFSRDRDMPLTLGIVVDLSGSQRGLFRKNRGAALNFLRQVLKPQDHVFIVTFGEGIRLVQDDTSSMRDIEASVGGWEDQFEGELWSGRPGSPIFESLNEIVRRKLNAREGRKALLLISDGEDTGSRTNASTVTERLQSADTMLYWLKTPSTLNQGGMGGIGGRRRGPGGWGGINLPGGIGFPGGGRGGGPVVLGGGSPAAQVKKVRQMTIESGGRVFEDASLEQQFQLMEDELRTQYTVSFAPGREQADGNVHTLEVRPRNPSYKVRHKPSYRDGGSFTEPKT
jgi:VWFA-related protein